MTPVVALQAIDKRFGAVQALAEVSLQVLPGAIHALVGENGAGKTTLMRVLQGLLRPDGGEIVLKGQPRRWRSAAEAIDAGIGMVSQHYSIIPDLTCLQNLILGAEPGAWIRPGAAEERAEALSRKMGFQFEWNSPARELSPAGAQKLEILKLLWREAEVMILDEPTAMLSPADADALFESLGKLTAEGATAILVTHRLPEVIEHCARVTVLRGGKWVADRDVAQTNAQELAELIVGRALAPAPTHQPQTRDVVLRVAGLSAKDRRGHLALKGAHFELRGGEVVGLAGVDGSGQRELFQALLGVLSPAEGEIEFLGRPLAGAPTHQRLLDGIRLIAEDRHEEAVVEEWSLEENVALGLQRDPALAVGATIRFGERRRLAEATAKRFDTKHPGIGKPMQSLSGGNQQRFVAARALQLSPKLVLAFQPTRGLDLAATQEVYAGLREAADAGAAVLVVSFDLDELLLYSDRILAICNGAVSPAPEGHEKDRAAIGRLMVGLS